MKKRPAITWMLLLATALFPSLSGCGGNSGPAYAGPADFVDERLVTACTGFGLNLFHALRAKSPGENIFISPAGIAAALAMTYNGAAGETQRAMAEVLLFNSMSLEEINEAFADLLSILHHPDPRVQLSVANSLWIRAGVDFHQDFLNRNRRYYKTEVTALDFDSPQAAETINGWVSKKTRKKIEKIVEAPLDPRAVLFLINALYFKGTWTEQFNPQKTRELPFRLENGSRRNHPIMFRKGDYPYLREESFEAISLPYGEKERISMYIFLPGENSSLTEFYGLLNRENWARWWNSFQKREVEIGLPRFKFDYQVSLNEALQELGLETAFNPGEADFSGMRPVPPQLYISEVKHKTFIEVNEEGTEAAAATSVEMRATGLAPDPLRMVVDRPFFLAIADNQTGAILFMGSVTDPGQD